MIDIINFDKWDDKEYKHNDTLLGGRSKKEFLKNTSGNKSGIFKYPKEKENTQKKTTEHVSEKLAYDISKIIHVSCAKVDIGFLNNEIGSISYLVQGNEDELEHGTSIINRLYPDYRVENHFDVKNKRYYSISMVEESLRMFENSTELLSCFYKMLLFDFLIGNSDRHSDNWALINIKGTYKFSPLYDNGSSLCSYEEDDDLTISSYLKDAQRYMALIDSKSKSKIRIDGNKKSLPKHSDVIIYLVRNNKIPLDMVERINCYLDERSIESIISEYPDNIISSNKKLLIVKFLKGKIDLLNEKIKEV